VARRIDTDCSRVRRDGRWHWVQFIEPSVDAPATTIDDALHFGIQLATCLAKRSGDAQLRPRVKPLKLFFSNEHNATTRNRL
jgi:hypothetical protein